MRKLWTVVCCLLVIPCAFAQEARHSSPDLRDNIKSGQKITVRLSDGRQFQGAVSDVTEAELAITTKSMREVIPAARIRDVRGSRSDSIWNGLIIGAGAGALVGLASNVLNDCDAHECGEAYAIPIGMGIGAAVGAGLDALWRHKPVLYRASETGRRLNIQVVAGKVTAAKVSWRF
jgi:hypothetical protein